MKYTYVILIDERTRLVRRVAPLIHLDTHAVAWLYAGRVDLFPERARSLLREGALRVSPIVELELQYLFETGRVSEPAAPVLAELADALGLELCDLPFATVVRNAAALDWARDPFDRLIVGQAEARQATLVTKDRTIRENCPRVAWD